ncbi:MAG: chromosome segregation protein SMC [Candidatus Omnitrophota bacterium]|nr:chromosome segregation protein SMC [Candidatus Omnitrophota bacterium]
MHFKSLELLGFKSFAEKTTLNFEPGVTAIVGPNGCGKSNIADGIRWVLGEQSAKSLRASNMQDVIFNGTDTKEPINFAEVSLIFSNEKRILPIDYDEVTITRRVFRSGETEYLLNKTPVRLKDISELLMGTGIGTESYSIIEQGKMDLILSSHPEDRRFIFEEASGITKYKSKKKEALRKLEQTEQNLLRINDIILEVKRQIGSIERQARKAERYKEDFDKLKDLEMKLAFFDYNNLRTQDKTYAVESADLKAREKDMAAELGGISSKISRFRQSLDEINQRISEFKNKYTTMSSSLEMNNHKIEIDGERIREFVESQSAIKKELEFIGAKAAEAEESARSLKKDLEKTLVLKSERLKLLEEKNMLITALSKEIEESDALIKVSKMQTVEYLSSETKIKNELIKLGADLQNRRARERRLVLEKETVREDLESVDAVLASMVEEFEDAQSKISGIRSDLDAKKSLKNSMASEFESIQSEISQGENRRAAASSKIELLEDVIKKHEGFYQGVKSLLVKMDEKDATFAGILGVVADMIKVEKGYEEAVNAFLGDGAQALVTEKDNDIVSAIEYLKANRLGKASFVSLETLKNIKGSRDAGTDTQSLKGMEPLKDFVSIDPQYSDILEHLFSNAYLAESFESTVADFRRSGAIIITKSGLMYNNGTVSGGSVSDGEETLLIGRKNKFESLKAELSGLEEKMSALRIRAAEKSDVSRSLDDEISSLEVMFRDEEINASGISMKQNSHAENAGKLKEEYDVADLELAEVKQMIDELSKKGESLNKELNEIERNKAVTENIITESFVLTTDRRGKKERLGLEIATLAAENQSVDKDEENLRSGVEREELSIKELKESLFNKENTLNDYVSKEKSLAEEITELKSQNGAISAELKVLNEESQTVESEKANMVDALSVDELQLKDKEAAIDSLRNQVRDLDVKLTEISYKKTNLKERIAQSYKIDIEETHMEIEDSIDWEALKTQVTEIKDKLDRMGPVNLVAIDEHKELEERHSFLVHQQEDLVNAKDSLMKAIQKINKTTKELFLETFQKIQVEFKSFFRLLFGGGQAELILMDEQDVLESGIEIIVRPPGKKLQNLMLLSGGEKAMTATALLFAIFKVKPSPFCVLDEIDAPLDESNVERFSRVLKDFLKISQFIIITHNKRTIELADVMYGITMQERGVSKIVSVKFLDNKAKAQAQEKPEDLQSVPSSSPS